MSLPLLRRREKIYLEYISPIPHRRTLAQIILDFIFPRRSFNVIHTFEGEFPKIFVISKKNYIGRGGYKLVYKIEVYGKPLIIKVAINKTPFSPLYGRLYREISKNLNDFLTEREKNTFNYLLEKAHTDFGKDRIRKTFARLALERESYKLARKYFGDLVVPTLFFPVYYEYKMPIIGTIIRSFRSADAQEYVEGMHLYEIVYARKINRENPAKNITLFDIDKLNLKTKQLKKKLYTDLLKLKNGFLRMKQEMNMVFDFHIENIKITREGRLKLFDFHVFDIEIDEEYQITYRKLKVIDDLINQIKIYDFKPSKISDYVKRIKKILT